MKKIGVLTWWRGNYGSILQAYALQEAVLKNHSYEYEIIDQYGKLNSVGKIVKKICALGLKKAFLKFRWKFVARNCNERNKAQQEFIDTYLHISDYCYTEDNIKNTNDSYDIFVCGSDQIWNPALSSLNDIYWLGFVDKKKKIAYAPSIGATELNDEEKKIIRQNLIDYSAISCREQSGTRLINDLLGNSICKTVADPTFLLTREEWNKIATEVAVEGKYIFAYILRGNKNQRIFIENFAKSVGLPIVTFPFLDAENIVKYDREFGDIKVYNAAPNDFITYIKDAEYVFTDSFHCSVFSILFHRSFFVLPKKGKLQGTRLDDILGKFELLDRKITDKSNFLHLNKIDAERWSDIDEKVNTIRESSLEYLYDALESEF